MNDKTIAVCGGSGCKSLGSQKIYEELKRLVKEENIDITVKFTGCQRFCEAGPVITILPDNIFYQKVKFEDCFDIIEAIRNSTVVERLVIKENENYQQVSKIRTDEISFFKNQTRLVLMRCGDIDPYSLEDYLSNKGYEGLKKAINIAPAEVIEIIKESGLRGRGGGGFSTGMKWAFIANSQDDVRYLICNADEGDPGSFMDRTLMEGDPFALLEGMTIAAYATNAKKGFIYCRAEYPESTKVLNHAINLAKKNNLLGEHILGKDFSFDIEVKIGAGAFVCGEETALMKSIEGSRGMPVPKPPFPAQKGLWGKPSNINNVKTYAYASHILREGADWFRQFGTPKSPGTAVLCLTGKIKNTGIVELPMGTPLRDVIYNTGGGIKNDKRIKAVLTGGPSGGCLPESCLDLGVDYESLTQAGTIMGSGGILILDETDSMVNIADYFLNFTLLESCGKCTPCREGLKRMKEILEKIKSGKGTYEDLNLLEKLGTIIKDTASCGLGQTAPNPVLTTLKYFKEEYDALIASKYKYYNITNSCVGCGLCKSKCPAHAISGEPGEKHIIDDKKCIGCGLCFRNCPSNAIIFNEENLKSDHKAIPKEAKKNE